MIAVRHIMVAMVDVLFVLAQFVMYGILDLKTSKESGDTMDTAIKTWQTLKGPADHGCYNCVYLTKQFKTYYSADRGYRCTNRQNLNTDECGHPSYTLWDWDHVGN